VAIPVVRETDLLNRTLFDRDGPGDAIWRAREPA